MAAPLSLEWRSPNTHVLVHTASTQPSTEHPSAVMIFGWMDANIKHLKRYAESTHDLFPSSNIIIIRSSAAFFFQSQASREAHLIPAYQALQQLQRTKGLAGGLLIHCFSNGGSFQLMTFRKLLSASPALSNLNSLPCALILDSCPGDHGLSSSLSSMAPSNPVLYLIASPIIAALYGLFALRTSLQGRPPVFQEMRNSLLEGDTLPYVSTSVSRVYIYSAKDRMVLAADIERHIAQAMRAGFQVQVEKFDVSPHVSHAKADGQKYWQTVRNVWDSARASIPRQAARL